MQVNLWENFPRTAIRQAARPYARDEAVHNAFSECAGAAAASPAIRCGDDILTYGELELRSNRLARLLQSLGVAPRRRVALLAERSNETVVAILAILKAGAAYVPLDVSYPCEQLALMVEDSAPVLIICQTMPPAVLAEAFSRHRVCELADLIAESEGFGGGPVESGVGGADTAYVMYTSGSTGKPKGVVVPHRAVTRLVREQTYASFASGEIFLQLAPLAFDASTFEIWGALLNGGAVAIVPHARPSLDQIAAAISIYRPTTAWFTAGLFNLLVDHKIECLRPLRQVLAGGDVLSPTHVRKALAALPGCTLVNGYGPTENTTFTCCYRVPREGWGGGSVPIGHGIAHTSVHVLDEKLRPIASGEIGELCIGGDGLADGYLNCNDLTAEKFVVDQNTGARLYRTGDLVRTRADGAIEFLGRSDTQVKIDGKRVELAEIETRLREVQGITDAVVVATSHGGGKRLIAYVTSSNTSDLHDPAAAIVHLRKLLPTHMIPAQIVEMDMFPLTPNGKIDRALLPDPVVVRPTTQTGISPTQAIVLKIWCDVLRLEAISTSENFFDLGGTSLRLIEAHERIQRELNREIEIVRFFEHPTVADIARFLDGGEGSSSALDAAQSRGARQRALLSRLRETARGMTR
jgi:amino acid adenylation domain-containing protein